MMKNTMTAEQQDPRPQQVRIHSNATAACEEIRERRNLLSEGLRHMEISKSLASTANP